MLKQVSNSFRDFKCGEVFCATPTEYTVNCCLCQEKVAFDHFPIHFRSKHLGFADDEKKDENTEPEVDPFAVNVKCELDELDEPIGVFLEETENFLVPAESHDNIVESEYNVLQPNVATESTERDGDLSDQGHDASWQVDTDDDDDDDLPLIQRLKRITKQKSNGSSKIRTSKDKNAAAVTKQQELKKPKEETDDNTKLVAGNNQQTVDLSENKSSDEEDDGLQDIWETNPPPPIKKKKASAKRHRPEGMPEKKLYCSVCCEIIVGNRALALHHQEHKEFKKSVEAGTLGPGVPIFKCEVESCGEVFSSESMLNSHGTKHKGFSCDLCGQSYSKRYYLTKHRLRHFAVRNVQCDRCDYKTYSDRELKAHYTVHTGALAIVCDICGKTCRNKAALTEHKRRHTGDRPYQCEVCEKRFFTKPGLREHIVSHTSRDDRPFECYCGIRTKTKKALKVHQKSHETEKPFECELCGKAFAKALGLRGHMFVSHDPAVLQRMKENTTRKKRESKPVATTPVFAHDRFIEMIQHIDMHIQRPA